MMLSTKATVLMMPITLIHTSYDTLVNILCTGAKTFVPKAKKNYYKYWWTEQLDLLKRDSLHSNNLWKAAGKPRFGLFLANVR